ncbi:MAG: carbohydrate ABC transporter substrate-binding protein [Eubacteriales bacterium]|nr:carbohydrate ABC transporter substrate-binding protein [Eubacteriales bacterium]
MKKLLSIALALVLALGLCAPAMAAESIQVAAIETAYGSDIWVKVAEAFTAQTGIAVDLITDKNLEDVIGPAMQGGEFPDVIHLATGRPAGLTEQFIKDNNIADITDVLSMTVPGEEKLVSEKIAGGFTDTSLTNPYNDGKTYLAPMFYSPCGLFYNAGLFEEKGWSVPATWDEMWALGETAKAEGIYLFTYPTAGYFDAFLYALMYSVGGPEFFEAATHYQEGIWDSEEAKTCFEIIGKLASYTNPITPAQANNQDFTQNQQLVLDNKALFMPNGTWIVGEMAEAPRAEGFKWGMTALPAVEEGGAGYSYTWFEQAWIPAGAANQDAAKQFLAFLYSDVACEIFATAGAIQPVLGIADKLEGDNVMFYSIYDNGAKAAMGNFAAFNAIPGVELSPVFFEPINSLVSGELTVDQWLENVKTASDQMRANLK